MKKITSLIAALIISVVSFSGISNAADSKKPIVIPTHNWSSQIVMAHVIGGIFEANGNTVKYVPADSQAGYESIRIGDVTISQICFPSSLIISILSSGEISMIERPPPRTKYLSTPGGKVLNPGFLISLLVCSISTIN